MAVVSVLVTIGVVMLLSASGYAAEMRYGDAYFFVKRQGMWLVLACLAGWIASRVPVAVLRQMALPVWVASLVGLVLARLPGIGICRNGSWRWIGIGPFTLQPSEFAKAGLILVLAWWLARNQRKVGEFRRGFFVPVLLIGCTTLLVLVEPDFGSTLLLGIVGFIMMFCAGTPFLYICSVGALGAMALGVLIWHNPERMSRIMAFLNPEEHVRGEAWQLVNSLCAFKEGGLTGVGLGNSMQKRYYLPEAHTDFIFAIIAEELGMIATVSVLVLFAALFICGIRIALGTKDPFLRLIAQGITFLLTVQALINLAVVTGCMPTKGFPLPFISYGGSSLLVNGIMIGLLLSVARTSAGGRVK